MAQHPNILLIMSDQHSPFFLGCRGRRPVRTANLDALAACGVSFNHAYCANPLCVPSRMTFLTSRFSRDIQVWTNDAILGSDCPTFVHHLNSAGYDSFLCGRMHFEGPDQRHGYRRRILGDVYPKLEHIPVNTTGQHADGVKTAGPGRTAYMCYDDEVTRVACRFLERIDRSPPDRPFFLTVGCVLPHSPYICPRHLFEEYMDTVDVPQLPDGYLGRLHPAMQVWRRARAVEELTDEQVRIARAAYFGLVTYLDALIGQVLQTLAETHFADNTVVIYTSDHGDMAGEHRMWWKTSFYEGSVGVPLILSWPGRFAEARTVDAVVSLLDIGPTLVAVAGGEPMPAVRGRSLLGFTEDGGRPSDWPDTAYAEKVWAVDSHYATGRMIRRGAWKLNHYHGYHRPQLFNLESDPDEMRDLGADPGCCDVTRDLQDQVLADWSGDSVVEAVRRLHSDQSVPSTGIARPHERDAPDQWTAPDGCNIFPEA